MHSPNDETDVIAGVMDKKTYLKEKEIFHFKHYRNIIKNYV
jgi:hypothetical protein